MTDEDMRLYNEEVDKLRDQGWKRLDAERDVWAAWLVRKRQSRDA